MTETRPIPPPYQPWPGLAFFQSRGTPPSRIGFALAHRLAAPTPTIFGPVQLFAPVSGPAFRIAGRC
jgi:hypothetical protein